MGEYLDADCVFRALFDRGIFTKKEWRLGKVASGSYDTTFEFADSARIAGFTIYVIDNHHYIGQTALANQARKFKLAVDDLFSLCSV